ncbi:MAG TPA: hypothetical protein VJJ02_03700, partial [Candidatus Paceibacterota bacterium]
RATKIGAETLSGGGRIDIGQAGGKGGREATGSFIGTAPLIDLLNKGDVGADRQKEVLARAEQRYKNDPAGKAAYLEANLGTMVNKDGKRVNRYLNDPELKVTRESVSTETRTKDAKNTIASQPKAIRDAEAEVTDLKRRQASGETVDPKLILDAEDKLTKATDKLSDAVKQLNGKEFGEFVTEKMLVENPEIMRHATRQQAAYMNTNYDKFTPEMMRIANKEVMENGTNEDTRQYFIRQAQLKASMFPTDLKEELKKELDAHRRATESYDATTANENARVRHFDAMEKLDARTQDILGAMSFKQIARLDDDLKSHEAMVRNYTEKHFNEIENYHKNIKQDAGSQKAQDLFAKIRRNATGHGTKATRDYMTKVNKKGSAYYDPTVPTGRGGGREDDSTTPDEEGLDDNQS